MKNLILISFVLLFFQFGLSAQEYVMLTQKTKTLEKVVPPSSDAKATVFEFDVYSKPEATQNIAPQLIDSHFLGEEIAKKMYLLDKTYTYEAKIAPGNPATTTALRKPVIYNSVKKIESYLRKSVRKKEISQEKATEEFNQVIEVALNVFFQNTDALESQIKREDQASDLLNLYTQRVHLNYSK